MIDGANQRKLTQMWSQSDNIRGNKAMKTRRELIDYP